MVFLDDLLRTQDFSAAVSGLVSEFRREHGLPKVHQLGLVVKSVVESAEALEKRGVGPFFLAQGKPVFWRERGEERSFRGRMGLAYHHGIELELLEPGEGSDFYLRSLDPGGRIVVQHLGFLVSEVDEWAERLLAKGSPLYVRGQLKSGPLRIDFAYLDTQDQLGLIIEFISWRLGGRPFFPRPGLIHFLGRVEKLSGFRCPSL